MKKISRALCAFENANCSIIEMLQFEFSNKRVRCGSYIGCGSPIGLYIYFWENQTVKEFSGDVWSIPKKNRLVQTSNIQYRGYDEVWVRGKPHLLKMEARFVYQSSNELITEIKKLCKKYKIKIETEGSIKI